MPRQKKLELPIRGAEKLPPRRWTIEELKESCLRRIKQMARDLRDRGQHLLEDIESLGTKIDYNQGVVQSLGANLDNELKALTIYQRLPDWLAGGIPPACDRCHDTGMCDPDPTGPLLTQARCGCGQGLNVVLDEEKDRPKCPICDSDRIKGGDCPCAWHKVQEEKAAEKELSGRG